MKPRFILALCSIALLLAAPLRSAEPKLAPIFNGRDLSGWKDGANNAFWRAENGVLVGQSNAKMEGNYLWTEKSYANFVLEYDVRWTGEIDSGVEFRNPHIQQQLGVSRSLKRDMSGSFYVGKEGYPESARANDAAKLMKPEGQWNTFRLEARGNTFTTWINGKKAVEYTNDKFSGAGPLGLQLHPGVKMKVEYRNLRLAELP